jgi:hypothetical protein
MHYQNTDPWTTGRNPLFSQILPTPMTVQRFHLQIVAQRRHLELRITDRIHGSHVNTWKSKPRIFEVAKTQLFTLLFDPQYLGDKKDRAISHPVSNQHKCKSSRPQLD